jgi:hypothetical protein
VKQIIDGKLYNTETATALADNEFADGANRMNVGRSTTLYKTRKGAYFAEHCTCWQGEHDTIEVLTLEEAKSLYEGLRNQYTSYVLAFGVEPVEA